MPVLLPYPLPSLARFEEPFTGQGLFFGFEEFDVYHFPRPVFYGVPLGGKSVVGPEPLDKVGGNALIVDVMGLGIHYIYYELFHGDKKKDRPSGRPVA